MKLMRVIVVSVSGILMASTFTAGIFASAMYSIPNLGHFGTGSMWWVYAAGFGALCGALWGFILGLLVGVSKCGRSLGGFLGGGMCFVLSAYSLDVYLLNLGRQWIPLTVVILLMLIPLGVVTGLALVSITTSGVWHETTKSAMFAHALTHVVMFTASYFGAYF